MSDKNSYNTWLGKHGESIASQYLTDKGYVIIARNEYFHWGEIDIIAQKHPHIVFVEVKTRVGKKYGNIYESITTGKRKKLLRSFTMYVKKHALYNVPLRFDVITIELDSNKTVKEIQHYENVPLQ